MTDRPTKDGWRALAGKEVKGRDLTWHVPEGFAIEPLYTAEDAPAGGPGLPGHNMPPADEDMSEAAE